MKFLDFFAGVGGFRRGMELAGHECVGFCEFDKFATASYTAMHLITGKQREYLSTLTLKQRQKEILKEEYRNGEWYSSDIRRVLPQDLPRADCWCFGFPCQDISIAGKQKGFEGNRSSLFFRVTGLLKQLNEEDRPKLLFIENVRNLLSINKGYDFARLLVELDEVGYDAEWEVINSKDFGVPQNRERVFVIGHLRGQGGQNVFPVERANYKNSLKLMFGGSQGCRVYDKNGTSCTLSGEAGGLGAKTGLYAFKIENVGRYFTENGKSHQRGRVFGTHEVLQTMAATDYKEPLRVAIPVLTPDRAEKRQNGRRFKENGEPSFTLTAQDRHGIAIKANTKKGYEEADLGDSINFGHPNSKTRRGRVGHGVAQTLDTQCNQVVIVKNELEQEVWAIWSNKYQCYLSIRRLTPHECFRLQGWTDDYFDKAQFVNSNSQLYKQAGNGVTVNVIRAIAEKFEKEERSLNRKEEE